MRLIALVGAKQSGKTTVSTTLVTHYGFQRVRFADALKRMLRTLGLTEAQIEGDQKEVPASLLGGKTPRWAMQSLGTEWGRNLISQDIWVNACRQQVADLLGQGKKVVIDDCRFPNEVAMIHELTGELWRIRRSEVEMQIGPVTRWMVQRGWSKTIHPSELYWPDFKAQVEIKNDARLTDLQEQVRKALRRMPVDIVGGW
jgi:adenylate kinase family enzyme